MSQAQVHYSSLSFLYFWVNSNITEQVKYHIRNTVVRNDYYEGSMSELDIFAYNSVDFNQPQPNIFDITRVVSWYCRYTYEN